MPRARAKVRPEVNFHARITKGEGRALTELVRRHGEKLAELGAAEADNKNAWFRSVIQRCCLNTERSSQNQSHQKLGSSGSSTDPRITIASCPVHVSLATYI